MLSRCIVLFITLCCTQGDSSHFHDKETGVELEVEDKTLLLEWFANNFKRFGTQLEFITDRSQEGTFTPRAAHSLFALA
jgi:peptide subunit release factor 1 (eRF1)